MEELDGPEDLRSDELSLEEFDPVAYLAAPETSKQILTAWAQRIRAHQVQKLENERLYPYAHKMDQQGFESVADVYRRAKAYKYQYLIDNMLPERSYGVIAAEYKAGKTWIVCDMIVNAIICGRFLDNFQYVKPVNRDSGATEDIRVAVFIGEGDENEFIRRMEAICEFYNLDPAEVLTSDRLLVQFRPPNVSDPDDMQRIHSKLSVFKPHLTILDPWYLSAGENADSRNLQSQGLVLRNIQGVCQDVGSALIIMHHWNQTGEGKGFNRGAGAGLQEWGRVLGNLSIESQLSPDPNDITGKTVVTLKLEFKGQVSSSHTYTREVSSDNRHDLSSPMHYKLTTTNSPTTSGDHLRGKELEFKILDATWLALQNNDEKWTKTDVAEEVTKAVGIRKADVLTVVNYMERYGLVNFLKLDGKDPRNTKKITRTVWKYPGEDFVRGKREELREGLVHEWQEIKIVRKTK